LFGLREGLLEEAAKERKKGMTHVFPLRMRSITRKGICFFVQGDPKKTQGEEKRVGGYRKKKKKKRPLRDQERGTARYCEAEDVIILTKGVKTQISTNTVGGKRRQ